MLCVCVIVYIYIFLKGISTYTYSMSIVQLRWWDVFIVNMHLTWEKGRKVLTFTMKDLHSCYFYPLLHLLYICYWPSFISLHHWNKKPQLLQPSNPPPFLLSTIFLYLPLYRCMSLLQHPLEVLVAICFNSFIQVGYKIEFLVLSTKVSMSCFFVPSLNSS